MAKHIWRFLSFSKPNIASLIQKPPYELAYFKYNVFNKVIHYPQNTLLLAAGMNPVRKTANDTQKNKRVSEWSI
jgi:hypothetical protein